jgi:hypothetical protein
MISSYLPKVMAPGLRLFCQAEQIPYRQGIWQGIFQNQLRLQICVELTSFISGTYSKIPYRHPGREFAL